MVHQCSQTTVTWNDYMPRQCARTWLRRLRQWMTHPNTGLLVAWLEALSDGDVPARMHKLQFTSNYDPEIVLRHLDVLESMRDDTRYFTAGNAQ
jgi:hypothetical protein